LSEKLALDLDVEFTCTRDMSKQIVDWFQFLQISEHGRTLFLHPQPFWFMKS
jgi:hypothetical protein